MKKMSSILSAITAVGLLGIILMAGFSPAMATASDAVAQTPSSGIVSPTAQSEDPSPNLTLVSSGTVVLGEGEKYPRVGDKIIYTHNVTNSGGIFLLTVMVTTSQNTSCDIGSLIPGSSATCTTEYIITASDVAGGYATQNSFATALPLGTDPTTGLIYWVIQTPEDSIATDVVQDPTPTPTPTSVSPTETATPSPTVTPTSTPTSVSPTQTQQPSTSPSDTASSPAVVVVPPSTSSTSSPAISPSSTVPTPETSSAPSSVASSPQAEGLAKTGSRFGLPLIIAAAGLLLIGAATILYTRRPARKH